MGGGDPYGKREEGELILLILSFLPVLGEKEKD